METGDNKPEKKPSGIFTFKPVGPQLEFLNSLVIEKGSITNALRYCVDQLMNQPSKKDDDVNRIELEREIKSNEKIINEYIERENQFQSEISNLKSHIEVLQADKKKKNEFITEIANNRTGIGML